jgi:phosphatidylserine/phosphatidylglycerophosphate/cardiolipin synthase-like enzyme
MSYMARPLKSGPPMRSHPKHVVAILSMLAFAGCGGGGDEPGDPEDGAFATGKGDGSIDPASAEARAVLAFVNAPETDFDLLDDDAKLNAKAAHAIIDHRDGEDGEPGTDDDNRFDDLAELDAVPFVGQSALNALLKYALAHGFLMPDTGRTTDVVFSPQSFANSHNARIAQLIGGAQHTLDIAMYSFSDAGIQSALADAVARGVHVRFIFDTASEDRKLAGQALQSSKSGRLEAVGVDVRWVNKIMHHKFMLIDGARDDAALADSATLVTGSANWSNGAATVYDENTLFLGGHRELNLQFQREFDLLWEHSRELAANPALVTEHATLAITDELVGDDEGEDVFYTSANFHLQGTDTFVTNRTNEIADQLVAAIEGATESIHIASGHLRSRPVAEALMAKAMAAPDLDIRVYLDGQEFISQSSQDAQVDDLADCIEKAGTSQTKIADCNDSGFLFGLIVGQSGVDVRYKYYAYRWDASYAVQMHHKYMVVDGDELWTGSYNLSDNAEHATFENMLHFSGSENAELVARYEANFESMWETGRAEDLLSDLRNDISTLATAQIPLVFAPMALTWDEVTALKSLIVKECTIVNSTDFRANPPAHKTCH